MSYETYKESLGIEKMEEIHYGLKELTTHANLKLSLEIYNSNEIILWLLWNKANLINFYYTNFEFKIVKT